MKKERRERKCLKQTEEESKKPLPELPEQKQRGDNWIYDEEDGAVEKTDSEKGWEKNIIQIWNFHVKMY